MKRLNLFIYSVLFMLSMSNAFAQSSSETIYIQLESADDECQLKDEHNSNREMILDNILPIMTYNLQTDEICIMSNYVTFDNVEYEICDGDGSTIAYDIVALPKNEKVYVSTATLCSGTGYIYIVIENRKFVGEFRKE